MQWHSFFVHAKYCYALHTSIILHNFNIVFNIHKLLKAHPLRWEVYENLTVERRAPDARLVSFNTSFHWHFIKAFYFYT